MVPRCRIVSPCLLCALVVGAFAFALAAPAIPAEAGAIAALTAEKIDGAPAGCVHRLYNRWSGEHLYTADKDEAKGLVEDRWAYEGVEWVDPGTGADVYRAYNPYTDEHLYTTDPAEYEALGRGGWVTEGAKFHTTSAENPGSIAVYRLYNEYTQRHLFTTDPNEYETNRAAGWIGENVKFYGIDPTSSQVGDGIIPDPDPVRPTPPVVASGTPIMGESLTSREAMRAWFADCMVRYGKKYPACYAEMGVPTPLDFIDVLWEETTAESVRPDVVLSMTIWETGWLEFPNTNVTAEQCNFGGIGVYGGSRGADFGDVRTGFRAMAQYMRLYADPNCTRENLAHPCVISSFETNPYKGKVSTVEGLSNTWAGYAGYADYLKLLLSEFPNDLA